MKNRITSIVQRISYWLRFLPYILLRYRNWSEVLFKKQNNELTKLTFRDGTILHGNSNSLLLTIATEIFYDHIYEYGPVRIKPDNIVIDIGANIGVFSIYASKLGAKRVYAYEPFPANIKMIKQNLQANTIQNVIVNQVAISDNVGNAKLFLGSIDAGNLLFDHNISGKLNKYVKVQTDTLESIIRAENLSRVDFLKIDCEGSEGAIITSTPKHVWAKIYTIALEYHNNVSILNHKQLAYRLRSLGYQTKVIEKDSMFGYIYAWKNKSAKC